MCNQPFRNELRYNLFECPPEGCDLGRMSPSQIWRGFFLGKCANGLELGSSTQQHKIAVFRAVAGFGEAFQLLLSIIMVLQLFGGYSAESQLTSGILTPPGSC